jgi:hypothetical protein
MKRFDVAERPSVDYETIRVNPLTPTIGATIEGIDLARPMTDQQFTEVNRALANHLVIFFRDQRMSIEQHKALGRRFGELHVHPVYGMKGHPEVLEIKTDEKSKGVAGEVWHTDVSCDAQPPMGSILYMHEVPANGGGDTVMVSGFSADAGACACGRSRRIAWVSRGAVMMKITSSTSMTSTSGVVLISAMGCGEPPRESNPPNAMGRSAQ